MEATKTNLSCPKSFVIHSQKVVYVTEVGALHSARTRTRQRSPERICVYIQIPGWRWKGGDNFGDLLLLFLCISRVGQLGGRWDFAPEFMLTFFNPPPV